MKGNLFEKFKEQEIDHIECGVCGRTVLSNWTGDLIPVEHICPKCGEVKSITIIHKRANKTWSHRIEAIEKGEGR